MQKVDKEKTRYYLAKIHILFRGNFRTQAVNASEEKDLMEDVFSKFPGTESGISNKVIIPYSFYDPEEYQPGSDD